MTHLKKEYKNILIFKKLSLCKMEKYFVYILYSASLDVFYKGFSTDVHKRLEYHLRGKYKYTSKVKDWEIVYTKEFQTKREALIEEKRLKRLNRSSIEKLIER